MRKWVAGISFCLAVILIGNAGWNFFQHHYCNAQRLNQELAAAHRPALLSEFLAQDRRRRHAELVQLLGGGALLLIAVTAFSGPDPEKLMPHLRKHHTPQR